MIVNKFKFITLIRAPFSNYSFLMTLFLTFSIFANEKSNQISNPLSLEEVFSITLERDFSVSESESLLREFEYRINKTYGAFLPQIAANLVYQTQEKSIANLGEKNQLTGKITWTQSIYAGGRDQSLRNSVSFDRDAQKQKINHNKNLLYNIVAKSFYGVLSSKKEVKNIEKSIDLLKKRIQDLKALKKIGKSRTIDLLSAEAQSSLLEAQLINAKGLEFNSKSFFHNLTGLTLDQTLVESIPNKDEIPNLETLLDKKNDRFDIYQLEALVKSSEYALKAETSAHLPSLDLIGNYYPYRQYWTQGTSAWDAQLVLSIPLFSGNIISSRVLEASEKKLQSELNLQERHRDIENEITVAYNNVISSLEQLKSLEKALKAAEQNYQEHEKDYRYSLATNLDVLIALNNFIDTQRTLDRTRYLALVSLAELKVVSNKVPLGSLQ